MNFTIQSSKLRIFADTDVLVNVFVLVITKASY
jgi:hypothetical protein